MDEEEEEEEEVRKCGQKGEWMGGGRVKGLEEEEEEEEVKEEGCWK